MEPLLSHSEFRHPRKGFLGQLLGSLIRNQALMRLRRALFARLPFLALESDVREVVYLNWLVDVDAAREFAPPGVELWERDGRTVLTVLTYRHGHLGPTVAGPLRRLLPSPLQSNWRLYVRSVHGVESPENTVLFIKNLMSSTLHTTGVRLFSDVLPAHVAHSFQHAEVDGCYTTKIDSGGGSAPSLHCQAQPAPEAVLPVEWAGWFDTWDSAVRYLCTQDCALVAVEGESRLAESRIALPIDFTQVKPLRLTGSGFGCEALQTLVQNEAPFCFLVPKVHFRVLSERLL